MWLKNLFDTAIRRMWAFVCRILRWAVLLPARCAIVALAAILAAQSAMGAVIRVDESVQAPGGPGNSWPNAYATLQGALSHPSLTDGDQIWVAASTSPYVPSVFYDPHDDIMTGLASSCNCDAAGRMVTFKLVKNISIYGGFLGNAHPSGGETLVTQADPTNNITTLSGDLGGGSHAYHVLTYFLPYDDTDLPDPEAMKIDGFVITGGVADGGMDSSPTLSPLSVVGGGALIVFEGHAVDEPTGPTFSRCTFVDNSAELGGGALAGVYAGVRVLDCTFEGNSQTADRGTTFAGKTARGGGAVNALGPVQIQRSTFIENESVGVGGGFHHSGALDDENEETTPVYLIGNCEFRSNTAPNGGGIGVLGALGVPGIVVNCLFVGNSATEEEIGKGGGVDNADEVHGSTFVRNSSEGAGAGAADCTYLTHNIFWDNTSADTFSSGQEWRAQVDMGAGTSPKFNDYNLIQDWDCTGFCMTGCTCTPNNFDADPTFVDEDGVDNDPDTFDDNDYRLATGSPAIDTGDPTVQNDSPSYFPPDTFNVDDDASATEATPDLDIMLRVFGATPDRGAYEVIYVHTSCQSDCVDSSFNPPPDGEVDGADLAILLADWGPCAPPCCSDSVGSDFLPPPDGEVDGADLAV